VPAQPQRLHEHVVRQIVVEIVGHRRMVGRLPTEPELADQFGVSRAVIREAVRVLSAKGLVSAKHGSGVWIQSPDQWDALDPLILGVRLRTDPEGRLADELIEARLLLEVEVAGLAAARRTESQLAELEAIIQTLDDALDDTPLVAGLDSEFHECLHWPPCAPETRPRP
jgi:DNA-binding FadR family transcriptional regulator